MVVSIYGLLVSASIPGVCFSWYWAWYIWENAVIFLWNAKICPSTHIFTGLVASTCFGLTQCLLNKISAGNCLKQTKWKRMQCLYYAMPFYSHLCNLLGTAQEKSEILLQPCCFHLEESYSWPNYCPGRAVWCSSKCKNLEDVSRNGLETTTAFIFNTKTLFTWVFCTYARIANGFKNTYIF